MRLSLVVPTYNMSEHLPALWASLVASGLAEVLAEVVIVDDGSTDATRDVVARLAKERFGDRVVAVHLPENGGRLRARLEGAKRATGERVLFLDSRLVLPDGFGPALAAAAARFPSVMGMVDVDVARNVFCLYWDRSHKRIFRRYYRDTKSPLTLTPDNYDAYLKGTTVFLCDRDLFVRESEKLEGALNDDTYLLKEIVRTTPITIDPSVRVGWVPRETWREFLARLWERGPSFVEYHVFEHRGAFFWMVCAGGVALVSLGALSAASPPIGIAAAAGALGLVAASTALFAESPLEAVKMMPLHVAVVATFGAGILRGIGVNARRALARRAPDAAAGRVAV